MVYIAHSLYTEQVTLCQVNVHCTIQPRQNIHNHTPHTLHSLILPPLLQFSLIIFSFLHASDTPLIQDDSWSHE